MEEAAQGVRTLRELLPVFTCIDQATASQEIIELDLKDNEKMKRFTQSYIKQNSLFEPVLLGLTAGLKKETVVRLFAEHWKGLAGKQHFQLKWKEFVRLLKQLSRPDSLGRLKIFECFITLLHRQIPDIAKKGFKARGFDSPIGKSILVSLRKALAGPHDCVNWPVSVR